MGITSTTVKNGRSVTASRSGVVATFYAGRTTERADAPTANFLAFYDDNHRMMAFICHNTDLADGWERMKLGGDYAKEYSIKKAIPMGTNVVFYALTQKSGEKLGPADQFH